MQSKFMEVETVKGKPVLINLAQISHVLRHRDTGCVVCFVGAPADTIHLNLSYEQMRGLLLAL